MTTLTVKHAYVFLEHEQINRISASATLISSFDESR